MQGPEQRQRKEEHEDVRANVESCLPEGEGVDGREICAKEDQRDTANKALKTGCAAGAPAELEPCEKPHHSLQRLSALFNGPETLQNALQVEIPSPPGSGNKPSGKTRLEIPISRSPGLDPYPYY